MKRSWSDTMPPKIERDGDGSYLYRWDVREETREMGDDMPPVISYSYNEVRVWPTLTANKILEACINALWDKDVEQKKLNDYNAAQLGILDISYIDAYREFLERRKALKEQVESDFYAFEEPSPETALLVARESKVNVILEADVRHYYLDGVDIYPGTDTDISVVKDEIASYDKECDRAKEDMVASAKGAETVEDVGSVEIRYPDPINTTTETVMAMAEEARRNSPEAQAVTFARSMVNSVPLTASQALEMQVLFPIWGEKDAEFGKEVGIGFRLRVVEGESDTLFEVIQKHKLQADWRPGVDTASLYKAVDVEHEGTLDDPIPYTPPMELYKDKYYTQGGVKYRCVRDSGQPMSHELSALIGLYVEKIG